LSHLAVSECVSKADDWIAHKRAEPHAEPDRTPGCWSFGGSLAAVACWFSTLCLLAASVRLA
jgi:hypothetical protein